MGKRAEVARGFTLLELIVTLAVLALAVAVVTPAIGRGADSLRARTDVAGFAAALRHARERAITTQRVHRVVIDPEAHTLTVVSPPGAVDEREFRETRGLSPRLDLAAARTLEISFDPQGIASGGELRLRSSGVVYRVTIDRLTGRVRSERE